MKLLQLWRKDLKHVIASPTLFMGFLIILFFIVFDPERHLWKILGIKEQIGPVFGMIVLCGRHSLKHPFKVNVMPFFLLILWSAGMGFYALAVEWRANTVYFEKSLAIRGITLMVSKTLSVLTALFFLICVGLGWVALEYGARMIRLWPSLSAMVYSIILFFIFILCFSILLIELGQLAYIVGRGFYRYRSLWMAFAFVLAFYLIYGWVLWLHPLFYSVPNWHYIFDAKVHVVHSSYFWPGFLGNVVLLALNGWLFEHWAKV